MTTMVADQIDPILIQSPGRDDCALELTRPCVPCPTAAPEAACPAVPAPALESRPIEQEPGSCSQPTQEDSSAGLSDQVARTRARSRKSAADCVELAQLARQIWHSHERYIKSVRTGLGHALKIGGLLLQAKRQIGHGSFTVWLLRSCPFPSLSTARAYMQLARSRALVEARLEAKHQPAGVLTISAVLRQIAQDGRRKARGQKATPEPADAQSPRGGPPAASEASAPIGVPAGNEIPAAAGPVGVPTPSQPEPSVDVGQGSAGEDPDVLAQVAELAASPVRTERSEATPAESTGTVADAPRPGSDPESGLADADWLASLPLRAALGNSAEYDADALL
jgi:hypothetical protein